MRRQWSTVVVLAASLVFLASLYLPWQAATCNPQGGGAGLLDLFSSSCQSIDGLFPPDVGAAAALAALVLAALAVTALVRPHSKIVFRSARVLSRRATSPSA